MKTKKFIAYLLAILMVMQSFSTLQIFAAESPAIEVSQASGHIGETVDITVSLSNNPGIVSMSLTVNYDKVLKLTAINDTGLLPGKVHKPSLSNPYYLTWANDTATENYTVNGNLVILTFEITEQAKAGAKYPVSVHYDVDNYDVYDMDMNCIEFELVDGYVEVISEHTHSYTSKIKGDATLKASATCTSDAEYYYSCECGEISTSESFFDEGSRLNHTGGTATCIRKAICENCGEEYGEIDTSNHNWDDGVVTEPTCIIKLYRYLVKDKKETVISKQIVRSGTSIGANINEANYGQSRADFISKMHIALKETSETEYWIRLLFMSDYIDEKLYHSLLDDCLEIKRILISSLNTAKSNQK